MYTRAEAAAATGGACGSTMELPQGKLHAPLFTSIRMLHSNPLQRLTWKSRAHRLPNPRTNSVAQLITMALGKGA
jgi:hypothetical protein